jgi:hypothetical protein
MNDGRFDPESDSSKDWFGARGTKLDSSVLELYSGLLPNGSRYWTLEALLAPRSRYPCGAALRHVTADEGGDPRLKALRKKVGLPE